MAVYHWTTPPSPATFTDIDMNKHTGDTTMDATAAIHTNAAVEKFWHLLRPIILGLQPNPKNLKISGQAFYMLRVRHPMNGEVVLRASVSVMYDNWFWAETAKLLQCRDEFAGYGARVAVWTSKLTAREVWTEITHINLASNQAFYRESPSPQ